MVAIIIGACVGIVFGTLQVLVISRVVAAMTGEAEPKKGAFVWVMLQFLANVAAFAVLGFYSMPGLIAAAVGLLAASITVWLIISNKNTREG